ncbi:hypothetical protein F5Y16DRAFT_384901 [Xylariaceae sp. FL0255]|nr:hypothetical protein F5Y16DRAFT_384901 [Xylariaceae sp. FL0255]
MGAQQPYLYDSGRADPRSPQKEFDPRAVTRASWEPKPKKPKKNGPLISFNRHPDAHEVFTGRIHNFRPMSDRTKWWIRWTRYIQLGLRVLELIAAAGLLTLMILISGVASLTAWVLRVAPGVIIVCNVYAVYHLARPARARPPASSAAYQFFAVITDLAIVAIYAIGAISTVNQSKTWSTILADKSYVPIFIESEYYGLIGTGGTHLISLGISLYLALMFRRIANMPPDMNPLESNLTSRVKHKRNKSSMSMASTSTGNTKRLSTPLENYRSSGAPYETLSRPPSIPFMHTRSGSQESMASKRDSRVDLPSRQYQITPGNSPRASPRQSVASFADMKRMSNPRLAQRGSYMEIPLHETGSPVASRPDSAAQPINASPTRLGKFTEAWYASESLVNRTQQRNRAVNAAEKQASDRSKAYEALNTRYGDEDEEGESDSDRENVMKADSDDEYDGPINVMGNIHPNPLRLNPLTSTPPRQKTPFHPRDPQPALTEMSHNARRSMSGDIADAPLRSSEPIAPARRSTILSNWRNSTGKGLRNSSIQPEDQFYSKPYGELKSATPPIMVGNETLGVDDKKASRQVSSGNDFDAPAGRKGGYRRHVSGRAAEEGLAGPGTSRFS